MADLIFNFDTNEINPIKRSQLQSTPGNWTHKLKQKRKQKTLNKKINQLQSPSSNLTSTQEQISISLEPHPHPTEDPISRKKPRCAQSNDSFEIYSSGQSTS